MRRYNQRLYRIARGILRDDAEAEDVMQDAYVRAYAHPGQFTVALTVFYLALAYRDSRGSGTCASAAADGATGAGGIVTAA
jgi:Sigma-70 region 2